VASTGGMIAGLAPPMSQRSGASREAWVHTERVPSHPIACQCTPCHEQDRGSIFARGPLGPEDVCWSRRAHRVQRGKGPASALLRVRPRDFRSQLKASAGSSLMQ